MSIIQARMGMGAAIRDEVNRSDELSGTGKVW